MSSCCAGNSWRRSRTIPPHGNAKGGVSSAQVANSENRWFFFHRIHDFLESWRGSIERSHKAEIDSVFSRGLCKVLAHVGMSAWVMSQHERCALALQARRHERAELLIGASVVGGGTGARRSGTQSKTHESRAGGTSKNSCKAAIGASSSPTSLNSFRKVPQGLNNIARSSLNVATPNQHPSS